MRVISTYYGLGAWVSVRNYYVLCNLSGARQDIRQI